MSGFEWLFLLRDSFQWPFLVLGCGRSMIFIELVDSLLFSISCSCRKAVKNWLSGFICSVGDGKYLTISCTFELIFAPKHTHTHTRTHSSAHTHTHTHTCTCARTRTRTRTRTYTPFHWINSNDLNGNAGFLIEAFSKMEKEAVRQRHKMTGKSFCRSTEYSTWKV